MPVNYRDAKGRCQPIDTKVKPTSRGGFIAANTTNSFTSLFGANTDNGAESNERHLSRRRGDDIWMV